MNLSEILIGGGGIETWVSGKPVAQYAYVTSPTDLEVYQRKTATGSGAIDPYNDTTNYRPVSIARLGAIGNSWSAGAWSSGLSTSLSDIAGTVKSNPALAAGMRTQVFGVFGKGAVDFLAIAKWGSATVSATIRAELVVDGVSIFDATFAAPAAATGHLAIIHGALASLTTSSPVGAQFMDCAFGVNAILFLTASAATSNISLHYAYRGFRA